jgi:hypothetical protein
MTTPHRLWVDDIRQPPDQSWTWVTTSTLAIDRLRDWRWNTMSLDHDLGDDDTTRPVVLWLCHHPDRWPSFISVHSRNPVGVDWLTGMIDRYAPDDVITYRDLSR